MYKKYPSLRYFARFRGGVGTVRAVVRYDKYRRGINTFFIIYRDQLPHFKTAGAVVRPTKLTADDVILNAHLKTYTSCVWKVVLPLIKSGRWGELSGLQLTTLIQKEMETESDQLQKLGHDSTAEVPKAFAPGWGKANSIDEGKEE